MSVRLAIQFGVQMLVGVQFAFDQQFKNESYEFKRCKLEFSLVLMFWKLIIFFNVVILVLRNMPLDTTSTALHN